MVTTVRLRERIQPCPWRPRSVKQGPERPRLEAVAALIAGKPTIAPHRANKCVEFVDH